ncbi:MAG TPA: AAA family ATPase [Micromonosporaceae bacterium]
MWTRRGGASPVMVGRDQELRRLAGLVGTGTAEVALIAGEPGIGKTRLVRELLAALPPDATVLVGNAEPGSLARPYELLLDAIDGRAEVDEAKLAALADPARSPVERLHTGLAIVADLVRDAPAVLVFEDLHWADSESAALFERLADQSGPRLLIGTYRPDEVTRRQPVAALLARMERRHAVTHVRLDRLTSADTATFLASVTGRPVPFRAAASLHHRTGGNPFFLEELLRECSDNDLDQLCDLPLPWSLAEVLRRHIDELAPASQRIVEAAAVLGHRIPFDLLAAVTGAAEDDLIAVLRDLVTRGVLVESGEDEFSFRHALVREAITGQMLGRQRRRLHEAALDALLAGGGSDPAMVAHHACAAGRYAEMVAAARRGCALYLSIGSAYQALQLAEMGLDEVADDRELLAGAARAAWLAGLLDDAVRYARRWRAVADTLTDRADALYLLIRLSWEADSRDEMAALTDEVETLVTQLPPGADQARAMTAVAQSMLLRDDMDAAVEWADRALALAEQFDLPEVRLAALVEKGSALADRPATASAGASMLAGLVDEAEKRGEWVLAARALNNLIQNVPPASAAERAELLERMRVDAERAGFESLAVAAYHQGRARLAIRDGDLHAAVAALEEGRRRDRSYVRPGRQADYHGVFLGGLYLEAGELDRVEQIIDDLRPIPQSVPLTVPGLAFHVACRRGDVAAAEKHLDEVLAALADQDWRSGSQAHDLISAALAAALPMARIEQMQRELLGPDVWDDYRLLVDAQVAEARGDTAAAFRGYRAVRGSMVVPPSVRGTAHLGAARCLLATGEATQAATEYAAAATLLDRWGGWRLDQLDDVRKHLGITSADGVRAVSGTAALTPREREVALLIADGLSNSELARRLYISPKTAAVHVSNILRKLGIASRTDVGALIGHAR